MSSAVVSLSDNKIRQLDKGSSADESVSVEDAKDTTKLSRILTRVLSELGSLKRRFAPNRVTFRDIVTTGTSIAPMTVRLNHGMGPVEWWPVRIRKHGSLTETFIHEEPESDGNTLVLLIYFDATIDIRIEESG